MPRVKSGPAIRRRRKKILKLAKGYRQEQNSRFRAANQAVMKAGVNAYRDRKRKKRDFRGLWIQRINAAARLHGLPYNRFIHGLQEAGVQLDRKVLAEIAVVDPEGFGQLAEIAKAKTV